MRFLFQNKEFELQSHLSDTYFDKLWKWESKKPDFKGIVEIKSNSDKNDEFDISNLDIDSFSAIFSYLNNGVVQDKYIETILHFVNFTSLFEFKTYDYPVEFLKIKLKEDWYRRFRSSENVLISLDEKVAHEIKKAYYTKRFISFAQKKPQSNVIDFLSYTTSRKVMKYAKNKHFKGLEENGIQKSKLIHRLHKQRQEVDNESSILLKSVTNKDDMEKVFLEYIEKRIDEKQERQEKRLEEDYMREQTENEIFTVYKERVAKLKHFQKAIFKSLQQASSFHPRRKSYYDRNSEPDEDDFESNIKSDSEENNNANDEEEFNNHFPDDDYYTYEDDYNDINNDDENEHNDEEDQEEYHHESNDEHENNEEEEEEEEEEEKDNFVSHFLRKMKELNISCEGSSEFYNFVRKQHGKNCNLEGSLIINYFTVEIFDYIFDGTCILAGGSMVDYVQSSSLVSNNFDFFFFNTTEEEVQRKIKNIITLFCCEDAERDENSITIGKLRFTLCIYSSISEILTSFDLDASGVGFDGKNIYMTERCQYSLLNQVLFVDFDKSSPTYECRLCKYSQQKLFSIYVPEYQPNLNTFEKILASHEYNLIKRSEEYLISVVKTFVSLYKQKYPTEYKHQFVQISHDSTLFNRQDPVSFSIYIEKYIDMSAKDLLNDKYIYKLLVKYCELIKYSGMHLSRNYRRFVDSLTYVRTENPFISQYSKEELESISSDGLSVIILWLMTGRLSKPMSNDVNKNPRTLIIEKGETKYEVVGKIGGTLIEKFVKRRKESVEKGNYYIERVILNGTDPEIIFNIPDHIIKDIAKIDSKWKRKAQTIVSSFGQETLEIFKSTPTQNVNNWYSGLKEIETKEEK